MVGSAFTAGYRAEINGALDAPPHALLASPGSAQAAGLGDTAGRLIEEATIHGWATGMTAAALILALGALFVRLRLPPDRRPADPMRSTPASV